MLKTLRKGKNKMVNTLTPKKKKDTNLISSPIQGSMPSNTAMNGLNKYQTAYNNMNNNSIGQVESKGLQDTGIKQYTSTLSKADKQNLTFNGNNSGLIQKEFGEVNSTPVGQGAITNKPLDKYSSVYNEGFVPPIPQQKVEGTVPPSGGSNGSGDVVVPEEKPLQNAYDNYKSQLDLNKISSQNEIANATKVAQQYMDNYLKYYGMQGSGVGQSAYANLASQQANQMAEVNRDYNTDLANYRQQLNDDTLAEGKDFAMSMNDEDWSNYLSKLQNDPTVDQKTLNSLNDYRNAYGTSSFETGQENAIGTLQSAIDTAIANGDTDKASSLREIYSAIDNAETQEQLDNALSQFEKIENSKYYPTNAGNIGATTGKGSKEQPYVYTEEKLADLKKLAKQGKLPEGAWVQYTNSNGKIVLRQVEDGKLKNRKTNGYAKGTEYNPYTDVTSKQQLENKIKDGTAKNGDYYKVMDGNKGGWTLYYIDDGEPFIQKTKIR